MTWLMISPSYLITSSHAECENRTRKVNEWFPDSLNDIDFISLRDQICENNYNFTNYITLQSLQGPLISFEFKIE